MFKSDQPIKSYKEDLLGRYSFARSLSNTILSYKNKDSIVIGLFGAWGSGKTSIINMVLEYIENVYKENSDDKKPIVMKFNPWNYSDQNQLISQFFKQLSTVLKRTDFSGEAKKIGDKMETYSKFFEPLALIPAVGPIATIISKVFGKVGSATKKWAEQKSNDLNAIKKELNVLLERQPRKIMVVIDDIDRLNNNEIRQIFQLIKTLGDFPNTIYLLAFDKDVVINALKKVQEGSGLEYLEKMVQVPFEIPLISKQEVERLLFSQLDEIIKQIPQKNWDKTYWGNIYHSGLKYFFKNIRDVTRYINSLRFSFDMVRDEVNPIDFLAITAIQVFVPEVYYGIRDNKDIFSGVYNDYGMNKATKDQDKIRCDEIIGRVNEPSKEVLKDFLKRLFPKLESIYGNTNYGYEWLEQWRKKCRICSPDNFDIFFKLSLPEGEISQKEIQTILSLANDCNLFSEALLNLNQEGRIIRFLERLEDYTQDEIPKENIECIITVLMDIGDLFPEGNSGFASFDTPMRLLRIFYQLSHRFKLQEERFKIFKNAIEKASKSLYTVVHEVSVQDQQHGRYGSKEEPEPDEKLTVNSAQLNCLEELACKKIEKWAEDGKLENHRKLISILYRWKEWGNEKQINKFVNEMIKNNKGLVKLLASFLSKVTSHGMSDYVGKIEWRINLKEVKEFIDIKEAENRVRDIVSSQSFEQYEEREKLAMVVFLDTIDGKLKGPF